MITITNARTTFSGWWWLSEDDTWVPLMTTTYCYRFPYHLIPLDATEGLRLVRFDSTYHLVPKGYS